MNFLLFCDKRQKRELETVIQRTENVKLLGTEVVVRDDFLGKVFDEYNPHGVIIFSGVRMDCAFSEIDVAVMIKQRRPSMRVIYYYGEVTDGEEFDKVYKSLVGIRIYDIITKQDFREALPALMKNPFTKETLDETLVVKEQEAAPEEAKPDFSTYYNVSQKVVMNLNHEALSLREFNFLEVESIAENEPEHLNMSPVDIGIISLQARAGCTYTAFELAVFMRRQNKKAAVIIHDSETYSRIAAFYGVPDMYASGGILLHGLNVFPAEGLLEARESFNFLIRDMGVLTEDTEDLASCHLKMMLCSAADWDLSLAMSYINSDNSFSDINYLFYPVSRDKFIGINKRMVRAGLQAYRLETSKEFHLPCSFNEGVYLDILKRFTSVSLKKEGRKGLRLRWG